MLYVLIIKIDKLMKNFGYNLEHINLIRLNLHWKTLCIPNQITKKIKRSPKWTFNRLGIGFPRHLPRYSRVLARQTYRAKLRSLSSTRASPGAPHMARARLQRRPAAGPRGTARTSISGGVELLPPERGRASPWPRSMNGAATEKGMEWIE